jgi:hypothetical protein
LRTGWRLSLILRLNGTIDGNRVELERDPGLPPGSRVIVEVDTAPLSVEERRRRIEESCGVWKDDEEIRLIFEEILAARRSSIPREVSFDAPA